MQGFFSDMTLAEFRANPAKFLGRWEHILYVGIRQYKAGLKTGETYDTARLFDKNIVRQNPNYPKGAAACVSRAGDYLHSHKRASTGQVAALQKFLIGTGQGYAIAPTVKLPVKVGVFDV